MAVSRESEIFQLVKADMERATQELTRLLTVEMFKTTPFLDELKRTRQPPTWRDRLRWKFVNVRNYFVTLWQALCGEDLRPPSDYDDW